MLPLLYLHGLSTGDFVPALEQLLGSTALHGLVVACISLLVPGWRLRLLRPGSYPRR